jgi:hypothetical protein
MGGIFSRIGHYAGRQCRSVVSVGVDIAE